PVQVIAAAQVVRLSLIDLQVVPEQERDGVARRLGSLEAQRSFDLARGPLLRATLMRLAEDEHVALLIMHHIVSDAWSTQVLVREVGALYDAFVAGQPSPLPALPLQYADYAVWQRAWLEGTGDRGQGTGGHGDVETWRHLE